MAANDLSYTNHDSTSIDLNDGTTYWIETPGLMGIMTIPTEPVIAALPKKTPTGIYQASTLLERTIALPLVVKGASLSALITNVAAIYNVMWPDVRDNTPGTLTYTSAAGNQWDIECILENTKEIDRWLNGG